MARVIAGPGLVGKVCPFCQTPIKPDTAVQVCDNCQMPHHEECWQQNGGCTTFGCASSAGSAPQVGAAPTGAPGFGFPPGGLQTQCRNHANAQAAARCARCGQAFCSDCLVDMYGQKYCGSCKMMAAPGQPFTEQAMIPCKEANEALTYAIVGLFCCGIVLEPIAISKAMKAKKMIEQNPRLMGSGKANAALIIAIAGLGLWVLSLIIRVAVAASGNGM